MTLDDKLALVVKMEDELWDMLQKRYDADADITEFKEPLTLIKLCRDIEDCILEINS